MIGVIERILFNLINLSIHLHNFFFLCPLQFINYILYFFNFFYPTFDFFYVIIQEILIALNYFICGVQSILNYLVLKLIID